MRLSNLIPAALLGMTGCATTPVGNDGLAAGMRAPVAALERALLDHPETPDAVGEAGTDVVVAYRAGIGRRVMIPR